MCGIAGIMMRNGASPDAEMLDTFARKLSHRGPDGEGKHLAGSVAMVQTRLAVIDLRTGDQPFYEPGGAALIANAEIYNYIELKAQLKNTDFSSESDCEPALHLYRRHGLRYVDELRGMYAIALHDPAENRLVLSRDPFGIKPLYYMETPDAFLFASEPQALLATGTVQRELNENRRDELLNLQFTCGRETIFKGINRVMPGETLVIRGGRIVERHRKPALPKGAPTDTDIETAMLSLDAALENSVMVHQRSDVPYGIFLSGGIDSSAVLALMARLNDKPIKTFTAGFTGAGVTDEREHARELATAVAAEFHNVDFTEDDFWSTLPQIAASIDDPAADYAILPTWKLANVAAEELKVVLSGEGGDELFAGYGRYRSVMRPWWQGGRTIRSRGAMDGLGLFKTENGNWRDGFEASQNLTSEPGRTALQIAQATDIADWLPNDLLTKLDRCLMAHGLEGRTPFLDPALADAAFNLPDHLKVHKGHGKWILRKWLDRTFPAAKPFSKKRGFTVPVGEWMNAKSKQLGELVAASPALKDICFTARVAKLYASTNKRARLAAWNLLFYALWHQYHIEGKRAEGDILSVLASR